MPTKLEVTAAYAGGTIYTDKALDAVDLDRARELWRHHRVAHGFAATTPPLIAAPETNAKLQKSTTPTYGLSLAPARLGGIGNVCTHSTRECRRLCLASAGRGSFGSVQRGRIVRTTFLACYPLEFRAILRAELRTILQRHGRKHVAYRPNVLSDLPWHREPWIQNLPKRLHVYGYTKVESALADSGRVDLTYSVSEREPSIADAFPILEGGTRIAVVTAASLPDSIAGWPTIDGDATDERWKDDVGIVRLTPKGRALNVVPSTQGFVKSAEWFTA